MMILQHIPARKSSLTTMRRTTTPALKLLTYDVLPLPRNSCKFLSRQAEEECAPATQTVLVPPLSAASPDR
jgi:hypothetical protein